MAVPVDSFESSTASGESPRLKIYGSGNLPDWLATHDISLGFTTYQAGSMLLVGRGTPGRLSVHSRTFARCMGMWASPDGQTIWLASEFQLWRFANALAEGASYEGCDRLFVPRTGHTVGRVDAHDLAVEDDSRVVFVATGFNCLATLSETHSLKPLWKPPFITRMINEDRCHLNGLAIADGKAKYVTCVSQSDAADGWRKNRAAGGVVIDIESDEVVTAGLSMPHSPRMHLGKLWLLNSGQGTLGFVDGDSGIFQVVAQCPGYARGLTFVGDYAVIGLSKPRHGNTFSGLPLDDVLADAPAEVFCGLYIVDLRTGQPTAWLRVEGKLAELYDVVALAGAHRPTALGFSNDDVKRVISIED